jgi:hypothetical protein
VISASLDEVTSIARGWFDSKARIRFIASLKSGSIGAECSVLSVDEAEIGLRISGQPRGIATVRLSGCEFFFGADDVPPGEQESSKFSFDTGISIITEDGESLWLIEIVDGPLAK